MANGVFNLWKNAEIVARLGSRIGRTKSHSGSGPYAGFFLVSKNLTLPEINEHAAPLGSSCVEQISILKGFFLAYRLLAKRRRNGVADRNEPAPTSR